jgi:hypothetical protein
MQYAAAPAEPVTYDQPKVRVLPVNRNASRPKLEIAASRSQPLPHAKTVATEEWEAF